MTYFLIAVWTVLPALWFLIIVNLLAGRWYQSFSPWTSESEARWLNKPWYVRLFERMDHTA